MLIYIYICIYIYIYTYIFIYIQLLVKYPVFTCFKAHEMYPLVKTTATIHEKNPFLSKNHSRKVPADALQVAWSQLLQVPADVFWSQIASVARHSPTQKSAEKNLAFRMGAENKNRGFLPTSILLEASRKAKLIIKYMDDLGVSVSS